MPPDIRSSSTNESADELLNELLNSLGPRAKVILPGDENFQYSQRIWNAVYDSQKPAIIVQVTGVGDVQACIDYARKVNITVTPRGGGHSWAGFSTIEGGLVIDFILMRSVNVDPARCEVTIEPGVLLGELDHETQAFGLATPVGVISHTGVYGLVLGGGIGWLCRKFGASVDNIVSANIVLANGNFVTASKKQNQDLFWSIRGAAQNFGIVTSITMKAHPVGLAYRGTYLYPTDQIEEVLNGINDFMQKAPREFNCEIYNRGRVEGSSEIYLKVCYSFYMRPKEAEFAADPLRTIGNPVDASWDWITHVQNQKIFDVESPHHRRYYAKSGSINFSDVNSQFIEAFRHGIETITSPYCMVEMIGLGGAMKDYPANHSAFYPLRNQDWLVNVVASWPNDVNSAMTQAEMSLFDEKHITWCRKTFYNLATNLPGYVNMMADSTKETQQERLVNGFGSNLKQLRIFKRRYDPKNFFRHNLNILPAENEES